MQAGVESHTHTQAGEETDRWKESVTTTVRPGWSGSLSLGGAMPDLRRCVPHPKHCVSSGALRAPQPWPESTTPTRVNGWRSSRGGKGGDIVEVRGRQRTERSGQDFHLIMHPCPTRLTSIHTQVDSHPSMPNQTHVHPSPYGPRGGTSTRPGERECREWHPWSVLRNRRASSLRPAGVGGVRWG